MPTRSGAKVVSYVDAGASSSDDNHLHGKMDNTTGKGTGTAGGDPSDSGESEDDWNDSSSASEEDENSSTASDHDEDSSGEEGTAVETATEEDTDGESDVSDVEMSDGVDEAAAKKNSNNRKRKNNCGVIKYNKAKKPRESGATNGTRMSWNDDMV